MAHSLSLALTAQRAPACWWTISRVAGPYPYPRARFASTGVRGRCADGVLTAEPECVVASVLEVTHVAAQQLHPLVVLAVGEVSQRALR